MFGEERARDILIKDADCVVAFSGAQQLGGLERETRVNVAFGRVDRKPDFLA